MHEGAQVFIEIYYENLYIIFFASLIFIENLKENDLLIIYPIEKKTASLVW